MNSTTSTHPEIDHFSNHVLLNPELNGQSIDIALLRRGLRNEDLPQREEKYFSFSAVSNSDMKLLAKHPQHFLEEKILEVEDEDDENQYMKMGNMIETKLLCPGVFGQEFVQEPAEMKSPSSGKQKEFCQLVIDGSTPEEAFRECYSTKRKSDDKIEENAQEKYENLKDFIELQREIGESGKTPYSADDMLRVNNVITEARTNEDVTRLLHPDEGEMNVQHPLCGTIDGMDDKSLLMKGLADWIIIKPSKIVSVDLKTTSKPLSSFEYDYHKRHYYRQQGLYEHLLSQEHELPVETKAVVMTTNEPYGSRVYNIPSSLTKAGFREAKALAQRVMLHLTDYGFEKPIEDQRPGGTDMEPMTDLIERHFNNAQVQTNGQR